MNATLLQLAERRATLLERSAAQRAHLSQALAPWRAPLAMVEQGLTVVNYVRGHPALLVGVVAFVAVLRPRRGARWLGRGWLAWRVVLAVERSLLGL